MGRKKKLSVSCGLAAIATLGAVQRSNAQYVPTGTLNTSVYGTTPLSVQTNKTTSPTDGGGSGGPSDEVTATSTGDFTQLANVYATIDHSTATPTLNMFIGGSLNAGDQGVSHYIVALQLNNSGVQDLRSIGNTIPINGSVYIGNGNAASGQSTGNDGLLNIGFDTGFKPNALVILDPSTNAYTGFTDLSGGGATTTITQAYNGALEHTPIGTGAAGDPGFAGATTGEEFSIPLISSIYTPGTTIEATVFTTNGGSDGRTNNQVLAPFSYIGSGPDGQVSYYDYTYIDSHEGPDAGRQFDGEGYPGNQYFVIPDATPEPASLGILGLGGVALLRRRPAKR